MPMFTEHTLLNLTFSLMSFVSFYVFGSFFICLPTFFPFSEDAVHNAVLTFALICGESEQGEKERKQKSGRVRVGDV